MYLFGITCNTLALSSQSPGQSRPAGGASDGYGWDEELLDRAACVRLPRPGLSESSSGRIHMSCHDPPLVTIGIELTGGHESVRYGSEAGRTDLTS